MDHKPAQRVEGLSRALRFSGSGVLALVGALILFQLRLLLHPDSNRIDFGTLSVWLPAGLILLAVVLPLLHQLLHAVAARLSGAGVKLILARGFPHVRPARPVTRAAATRFFLLPQLLTLICLGLIGVRSLSAYAALSGAINLGFGAGDIWKVLGLRQINPALLLRLNLHSCDSVEPQQ